jgi:hypothetical protein
MSISRGQDFLSADATFHLKDTLDTGMKQQFPFADGVNPTYLSYVARAASAPSFVSFSDRLGPTLRAPLVDRALDVASDPNHPAYCRHGSAHGTFEDAIKSLRFFVSEMQGEHRWGDVDVKDLLDSDGVSSEKRTKQRFIIETPEYERTTGRPKPFLQANEMRGSIGREGYDKALRRLGALDPDAMAGAIISAFCLNLSPKDVLAIFGNKEYRERLLAAKFPKYALLQPNNIGHQKMVHTLHNYLTLPTSRERVLNYSPEAYMNAVAVFENNHMIRPDGIHRDPLKMTTVKDKVIARAVFASAEEKAQRIAPKDFQEPVRTKYIDTKYGRVVTTDLITAYLLFPDY